MQIKENERFMQLIQNRWAKPRVCKKCLREMLMALEDPNEERESDEEKKRLTIIENIPQVSKNGWMANF